MCDGTLRVEIHLTTAVPDELQFWTGNVEESDLGIH